MQNDDNFERRKSATVSSLVMTSDDDDDDKSRAGRVDERVRDFVERVNACENIFTTSSCSGRVSVFAERTEEDCKEKRKGGEWVFVSHELVVKEEEEEERSLMVEKMKESLRKSSSTLTLRFEPFILAVETKDEHTARMFVKCARDAGYRESGVVSTVDESKRASGSGRITASARCSIVWKRWWRKMGKCF